MDQLEFDHVLLGLDVFLDLIHYWELQLKTSDNGT